jgi:hypothetical protein
VADDVVGDLASCPAIVNKAIYRLKIVALNCAVEGHQESRVLFSTTQVVDDADNWTITEIAQGMVEQKQGGMIELIL